MTRLTDQQKQQIKDLLLKGYLVEDIARVQGVPVNSVLGVLSGLKRGGLMARNAKRGFGLVNLPPPGPPTGTVYTAQPFQPFGIPQYPPQFQSLSHGEPVQPAQPARAVSSSSAALQPSQTLVVEASAMVAKVFNNPKMLLWYDWFKARYGYELDYADFLEDCVEDFFKSRGWQIVVTKTESGSNR